MEWKYINTTNTHTKIVYVHLQRHHSRLLLYYLNLTFIFIFIAKFSRQRAAWEKCVYECVWVGARTAKLSRLHHRPKGQATNTILLLLFISILPQCSQANFIYFSRARVLFFIYLSAGPKLDLFSRDSTRLSSAISYSPMLGPYTLNYSLFCGSGYMWEPHFWLGNGCLIVAGND